MDKPFSLVYEEFKQSLRDLINKCGLPPFVIESLLQNYLYEINTISKNQYLLDKDRYEKLLLEKEKKDKKD